MPLERIEVDVSPILLPYFQRLVDDLKGRYLSSGLKAHGTYGDSLRIEEKKTPAKYTATIYGADHLKYMTEGREPTTASQGNILYGIILDWVKVKQGLPPEGWTAESFAYVVTRRIHSEGIQVPNRYNPGDVVTKPIDDFERKEEPELLRSIRQTYSNVIRQNVRRYFNENN